MAKRSRSGSTRRLPLVLIIDDNDADANAAQLRLHGFVRSIARSPNEVEDADLEKADVLLVDFRLDDWPERDDQGTPSLKPQDGIALAATLRSNLGIVDSKSPKAFALHSGKLDELSGRLSPLRREHAIARMLELEWVFPKALDPQKFATEVRSLAIAVKRLPRPWPRVSESRRAVIKLLGIDERRNWARQAIEDVDKSNPPQDILAETTRGIAVIRWLLHEVIPFPSFLLDDRYLAARLHVTPQSLRQALNVPAVQRKLRAFEYRGILDDFAGVRWWRAGIEHWLWRATKGQPFDPEALRTACQGRLSRLLRPVDLQMPVVVLDDQFRPTDRLIELSSAVQVKPDDWPPFADNAWVGLEHARQDPGIAARVVPLDRERVLNTQK